MIENQNTWSPFSCDLDVFFMLEDALYALYSESKKDYLLVVKPEGSEGVVRADNRAPVLDLEQYSHFQIFTGSVHPLPGEIVYKNTKTVVVVAMMAKSGIVLTRRADPYSYGKLALPAGFQEEKDGSWQQAAVREVQEETGIELDPRHLMYLSTQTVENGKINLLFCYYLRTVEDPPSREPDDEVLEVLTAKEPVELAFDTHTRVFKMFLKIAEKSKLF